jgi:hypothetical protein
VITTVFSLGRLVTLMPCVYPILQLFGTLPLLVSSTLQRRHYQISGTVTKDLEYKTHQLLRSLDKVCIPVRMDLAVALL